MSYDSYTRVAGDCVGSNETLEKPACFSQALVIRLPPTRALPLEGRSVFIHVRLLSDYGKS